MAVYDPRGSMPIHFDRALTQISVGWPTSEFVGPQLLPAVNVRKQSDKYYIFGREAWKLPVGGDLRAPGAVANEVGGLDVSTDSYFAQEHALQIPITDEERENQDAPLNSERDGTELITSQVLLARELAIKTLVTTAANYAAGNSVTLAGSDLWDVVNVASDPVADHRTARSAMHAKIFLEPNVEVIPYQVMAALESHATIIDRIKYSERAILTPEIMAAFFGIQKIIVPGVGYDSANPGQTAALGYIWGKDVVMAYVPPRPGLKIPAFGYEFVWGYPNGTLQAVERWREESRVSDLVRVRRRYDLKLVAKDGSGLAIGGYLIKQAIT